MSLAYILKRVASECGIPAIVTNPPDNMQTDVAQRGRAIDLINIACEDMWEATDLPGSLMEFNINVLANNELAFPPYVGELRAMREKNLMHKWTLNDMRPRYQNEPWKMLWRNWRHKGYRATQLPVINSAPLTLSMANADNTKVTIVGSTAIANRVSDVIVMANASVTGTQSFVDISSITKQSENAQDITITDASGDVIAVLYNNELETRYILVDISQYPFGGETNIGERVMEVLYLPKLKRLENDGDCFPVPGFDNIIVDRAIQAYSETDEGKEQRALLYKQKADMKSEKKIKSMEGGIEKEIQFEENPMYGLTKRPYSRIWRG